MGYYGLININKNQCISSCWTDAPSNDDLKKIAKELDWDLYRDIIITGTSNSILMYSNNIWYASDVIVMPIIAFYEKYGIKYNLKNRVVLDYRHFNYKMFFK